QPVDFLATNHYFIVSAGGAFPYSRDWRPRVEICGGPGFLRGWDRRRTSVDPGNRDWNWSGGSANSRSAPPWLPPDRATANGPRPMLRDIRPVSFVGPGPSVPAGTGPA